MPQAVGSRAQLSIIREALGTPGTTPANPQFLPLAFASSDFASKPKTQQSRHIIADRNPAALVFVGRDLSGGLDVDLIADAYEMLIEGAFMRAWFRNGYRSNLYAAAEITAASATAGTAYTVTSVAGRNFARYMVITASGFAAAGNNRTFIAQSGTNATTVAAPTGGTADASPAATARLKAIGFEGPSGDITATASGLGSTAVDFTTFNLQPGQWLKVGGPTAGQQFATSVLNDYVRVSLATAVTATALPLDIKPSGWAVDAGTGKTIRVYFSDFTYNGTTRFTHTFERAYLDIGVYEYFAYTPIGGYMFEASAEEIVTAKFDLISSSLSRVTSRLSGATDLTPSTASPMNASTNIMRLAIAGAPIVGPNYVLKVTGSIKNNLRKLPAVGTANGIGVNYGKFECDGDLETYFGDKTYLDYLENQTNVSLQVGGIDSLGNALLHDFPNIKLVDGAATVDSDEEITIPFKWGAEPYQPTLSGVTRYAASISRFEGVGT